MTASTLDAVPLSRRRRSAIGATALALVMIAAGLLPWLSPAVSVIRFLGAFTLAAGLLAAFVAAALWRSVAASTSRRAAPNGGCAGGCQCGRS